nr:hypothetical protein [Tanacetum cinerariifolium]
AGGGQQRDPQQTNENTRCFLGRQGVVEEHRANQHAHQWRCGVENGGVTRWQQHGRHAVHQERNTGIDNAQYHRGFEFALKVMLRFEDGEDHQ